jgi:glucose uptake protein GlcU
MTQTCISFFVLNFGHWDLDHYLIIGAWNLVIIILGGIQFAAFGHIEEDSLSCFIDPQCLPLFVNMFNH